MKAIGYRGRIAMRPYEFTAFNPMSIPQNIRRKLRLTPQQTGH